jgi:hypothetical protein
MSRETASGIHASHRVSRSISKSSWRICASSSERVTTRPSAAPATRAAGQHPGSEADEVPRPAPDARPGRRAQSATPAGPWPPYAQRDAPHSRASAAPKLRLRLISRPRSAPYAFWSCSLGGTILGGQEGCQGADGGLVHTAWLLTGDCLRVSRVHRLVKPCPVWNMHFLRSIRLNRRKCLQINDTDLI